MKCKKNVLCMVVATIVLVSSCENEKKLTITAGFENLELENESYWAGQDTLVNAVENNEFTPTRSFSSKFTCENIELPNLYVLWLEYGISSWSGFAYSNISDNETPGIENQFSAYPGSGANSSSMYVVAAPEKNIDLLTIAPPSEILSISISNNTYAALSMKNGDAFSKKFGGEDGNDPDWFKVTIAGLDENGEVSGEIDVYLADFRFEDNQQDYISDTWTEVDVNSFGKIKWLQFSLSSSDTGEYGMNTPGFFCLDNILTKEE